MQTDLLAADRHEPLGRLNEAEQLLRKAAALIGEADYDSQPGARCAGSPRAHLAQGE
ncbi:hypothetical protein [Kitasatospora sp. GP82]|uniref:hypothetical protein n=1 Tax=Kitasatospora sp. GP82 TaxID=3035089 RepID=UPI0024757A33|nr:hypothetical protein [Kitasatospora sp. GP82]MDH6129405.1 hypothetical protein [Kitasatospora sp. GP82]